MQRAQRLKWCGADLVANLLRVSVTIGRLKCVLFTPRLIRA